MKRRRLGSRFAPRRRGDRAAWFPIALRWRRPHRWLPATRDRRAPAPLTLHVAWLAHIHLHFGAQPRERGRRVETVRLFTTAASHRTERLPSNRHSTVIRAATLAVRMHRVYGGPVVIHHASRNLAPVRALRRSSRLAPRPVVVPAARLPLSGLVHNEVRTSRVRHERALSVERIHSSELRTLRLLASTHAHLVHRQFQERATTRPPVSRPAELFWRREPRPAAEMAESSRAERAVNTSRSVPLESIAAQSGRPAAALQAARIDLDRLTDDVIRRVERRARIERERRGL